MESILNFLHLKKNPVMRVFLVFISFLLCLNAKGQNLEAYFNITRYDIPEESPFIDVFISFNALTVNYTDNVANIESTILIKDGDRIVDFRKTKIISPELDVDSVPVDFIDVQRFSLKNGKYTIDIALRDLNELDADTVKISYPFEIRFSGNQVEISDIELVDRIEASDQLNLYTKSGYQVIPYVSDYYNSSRNEIMFYAEIYNSDNKFGADSKYLVISQITNTGGDVIGNYRKLTRLETADVSVVLNKFNISELYSGTYLLHIEVRDQENKLIKDRSFQFFRNNSAPMDEMAVNSEAYLQGEVLFTEMIPDREVLLEYIRSMWPRGEQLERNIIDKQIESASTEELQQFMYNFWYKRDPKNPQEAWDKYYDQVKLVNSIYSTQIMKGYKTDRGRVFLQYGEPNKLVDVPSEPSSYPYQIWQYYHIESMDNTNYSDVKFVFIDTELSTNNYVLLHSDMRGEVYNRRWEAELHSRTTPMNDVDQNNADDHMGGRAQDYFDNPR
jgi:GWxTD domain-containing protein